MSLLAILPARPARAQESGENRMFYECLRKAGSRSVPYGEQDKTGALGAYRFSVNALFEAGVCQQGKAPAALSYDWNLCDFKGPPATINKLFGAGNLLARPEMQDRLVAEIVRGKAARHRDLLLDSDLSALQRFNNASDLLGGLIYRRGLAAVKLQTLTNISNMDASGYKTADYVRFLAQCAGDNRAVSRPRAGRETATASGGDGQVQVAPVAINWLKLSDMPAEFKDRMLKKVPELRVVMNPTERHGYAQVTLGDAVSASTLVGLTGVDFCSDDRCTYYLFRNNFADVVIFYAGRVMQAPGRNGLYVDGFYKPVGELER